MTIADLLSKRHQKVRPEATDAHEHPQIPGHLRVQIAQVLRDLCGHHVTYSSPTHSRQGSTRGVHGSMSAIGIRAPSFTPIAKNRRPLTDRKRGKLEG